MWEDRELGNALGSNLAVGNIMLLINGDKVKAPAWVTERAAQRRATKIEKAVRAPKVWEPSFAPMQVPLVDLLQQISHLPVCGHGRQIVIMISAWDKAEGEEGRADPSRLQ